MPVAIERKGERLANWINKSRDVWLQLFRRLIKPNPFEDFIDSISKISFAM